MSLTPFDSTELFDSIVFAGVRSPGVVKLSGFDREENLDVKESDGQKGATTTWKGEKCGSGTATFYCVTNDEIDEVAAWDAFELLLWSTIPPQSGAKPVAKDVYHPELERNHYTSLILRKMGRRQHDTNGGMTIAVELAEYYPAKAVAAGGASGSKTAYVDASASKDNARQELIDGGNTPP